MTLEREILEGFQHYRERAHRVEAELLALRAALRANVAVLRDIADDLEARWDMRDPHTNPGIRHNVERAKAAIVTAEALLGPTQETP